jgi:hypothetical protein
MIETLKGHLIVVFPNSHGRALSHRNVQYQNLLSLPLHCSLLSGRPPSYRVYSWSSSAADPLALFGGRGSNTRETSSTVGSMTLEEAKNHCLALMKERKFTKQDWNIREIELREHWESSRDLHTSLHALKQPGGVTLHFSIYFIT